MSVPQGVVSQDETTWIQQRKHHLVGFNISALVAVDKSHIERDAQLRSLSNSIANDKLNLVCHWGVLNPRTRKILLFIVDFEGIDHSTFL